MKTVLPTLLLLATVAFAAPALAAEAPAAEPAATPVAKPAGGACAQVALAGGNALQLFPEDPTQQTCTVTIECADGSIISCMGNTTCSTSSNGRCTICDGVQTACCALTCCEQCEANYDSCIQGCDPTVPITCNICERVYNRCVNNCTGGCF